MTVIGKRGRKIGYLPEDVAWLNVLPHEKSATLKS